MGQQNSYQAGLNCQLSLVQQLPIGKIYKQTQSQAMYFIKEYAYTSQQAFQQAFLKFSAKLTSKNDNVLNLQKTNTKVDNTFCSTFYKIVLIFEYVDYSLADEIIVRNKQSRVFEEKEIWSILFHCTLGISHLKRTQGVQHSAISLKDIKLSQDGTIKIIPTQMVGIYSQHEQTQGTTKMLAMTILSCILMKQITNKSSQYLQALIDKTKCSKELKKVLYFMIMDDTTFKQLQQYLFKLANDENDMLSGVSTPVYSTHKKNITDSNVKKITQQQSTSKQNIQQNQYPRQYITNLSPQKQDQNSLLPIFQTYQTQNPDQTDQQKNLESQESYKQQTIETPNYQQTNTFSNQNNINIDFKLKDYASSPQNDVTVRMIGKKNSDFDSFANTSNPCIPDQQPEQKTQGLYTDPKLLDLIKKDLEQIQQKSRITYNALIKQSTTSASNYKLNMINRPIQLNKPQINQGQNMQKIRKNSLYNISASDFNIKPVGTSTTINSNQLSQKQIKQKSTTQIPMAQNICEITKRPQQIIINKSQQALKQIQNVPKRSKQQQCFGNILNQDAGFKKPKSKKVTIQQPPQNKKDIQKQNHFQSSQTKRINQNYQKNNQNLQQHQTSKSKQQQNKLIPQTLSQTSIMAPSQSSLMQFVNQTYQKGEYKGYKLNGLRHGHGTFYYKEGGKYVGQWKQNKMNGKGTLYYPNDQIAYEGNWKDDQLHGYGTLYNQQVVELQKSFDYQDWSMVQEYWVKYEGQFSMDNKQGKGKLYLSNGEIFEGTFKQDMVDGQGVLSRQNGSRVRGIWRKNKLLRMF